MSTSEITFRGGRRNAGQSGFMPSYVWQQLDRVEIHRYKPCSAADPVPVVQVDTPKDPAIVRMDFNQEIIRLDIEVAVHLDLSDRPPGFQIHINPQLRLTIRWSIGSTGTR